ncbi:zinc-finger homeodomain protein 3-like [Phragmites australis]|uniref:zinc-finger homeodomain protein 3-like n=1 Tax=Phragmites australis TaxID=29695 RepID=UPI002D79A703|nr:zinc-finger homeodomain protein 3-like [Phragmites australis]XP_062202754.1 zinc-finger homeodomain protein 3-like [Phragmites australis]XP_062202755.1 zinc-finger homeodomain protein 3-like [Phragmites australis]
MDLSGPQGELPMAMHGGGGGLPYLGLHHEHEQQQHHHHHGANGRHMSPPEVSEESKNRQVVAVVSAASGGGGGGMRYRECLKNHAAAIGGSATDGCGEFMPAGEEGSLDALRCSACGCHRNFHRKEPPGGDGVGGWQLYQHHQLAGGPLSPLHHHHRGLLVAALPPTPTRMVMPLNAATMQQLHYHNTSAESDDARAPQPPARKRFRTKFTAEQKARMLGFAEEVGWRLQKLEDAVVQRFCQEVGVKRRVLKVWMHNNKHTLARRHGDPQHHPGGGPPHPEPGGPGRSPSPSPPQLLLE